MLSPAAVLVMLMFTSVTKSVQSAPTFTVGIILPTWSDLNEKRIVDVDRSDLDYPFWYAIEDVNNYFDKNFTLSAKYLDSAAANPIVLTNQFLQLLSSESPPVALIGPFYLDRLRYIAPLAEMSRVSLVSPWISLSQMNRFLPHSNRMSLSMQAAENTYGDELIQILKYHGWSDIALIITQSPLRHLSPYEKNVKSVRFPAETVDVTVVATAWIPPLDDYGNDKAAFEAAVAQEIEKIWSSGATIIVLSIEQITMTYEILMQAANNSGLINAQTAWISLDVGSTYDYEWSINNVRPKLITSILDGMIVTATDLKDYNDTPLLVKTRSYIERQYRYCLVCQLVYDSVWAVAFAINKILSRGVSIVGQYVQIGGVPFQRWSSGEEIVKKIKETKFVGWSGLVSFNDANVRLTWKIIYNIRSEYPNGYYTGYCGFGKIIVERPILWHNSSIRSPIGKVDICRHRINVLIPGGRYGRYIDFSENKNNKKYFGWAVDLFEKAATSRCLNNFKYYHVSNITWDEAIEIVGSGLHSSIKEYEDTEFHVAIGPFAITPERNAKADFTSSIKSVSYRVAILKPEIKTANFWQFFKPFSWQLWLLVAAFFVSSGFTLFALEKNRKRLPRNSPKIGDSIFVSISALFYTHDQNSVLSNSGRGYIAIICFVVLILCACFTANLSVFLLKRQQPSTYTKIEDIHDGVIGASKMTGALAYLQHHYPRLVFEDVSSEDWLKRLRSKVITAYIDDSSALEFSARTHCDLLLLSEKLHVVNAAFALKQNSPYKEKLNRGILEAWFDKFIEDLEQKYFEWADECQGSGEVAADEPLTLHHLGGLFIILIAVAVLCVLGDFFHGGVRTAPYDNSPARPSGDSVVERNVVEETAMASTCSAVNGFSNDWTVKRSAEVADEQMPDLLRPSLAPPSGRGPLPPIDL